MRRSSQRDLGQKMRQVEDDKEMVREAREIYQSQGRGRLRDQRGCDIGVIIVTKRSGGGGGY